MQWTMIQAQVAKNPKRKKVSLVGGSYQILQAWTV